MSLLVTSEPRGKKFYCYGLSVLMGDAQREFIMAGMLRFVPFVLAAGAAALVLSGSLAAAEPKGAPGNRSPAGQMCPKGSYVIGFDSEANIVCREVCGNGLLDPGEACDDGNSAAGDGCSATCQAESVAPAAQGVAVAPAAAAGVAGGLAPNTALAISDIEPSSVMYGTRELAVTISGTGFAADSLVVFAGETYQPSVNQAGTRLDVTLATRKLSMGTYAISVSNGSGPEQTLKKALTVF
jgi:cysteine-rich repeat protein